jgi:hypothetical protein
VVAGLVAGLFATAGLGLLPTADAVLKPACAERAACSRPAEVTRK